MQLTRQDKATAKTGNNERFKKIHAIKKQTFPIEVENSVHCFAIKFRQKAFVEISHVIRIVLTLEIGAKRVHAGNHSTGVCIL